ncbi:MAG TPA: 6-phosphogluconolactonase [Actinomycetota bacterium]|nr:6-phosphogluconolactonase [Actinomycetota bacterium]
MSFDVQVFASDAYPLAVARRIADRMPSSGSLVLTGGTTAARVYECLADFAPEHLTELDILFSDERCVPPDDPESNYLMARTLLLEPLGAENVHRMRGEDPPEEAAAAYHSEIAPIVERGLDLLLLGMGADAHVGAMFPGSPVVEETESFCAAVDRPDGMRGLTLTPPAMLRTRRALLLVTGEAKAATVARVLAGAEPASECPARILAPHPDVTFLLDTEAASAL